MTTPESDSERMMKFTLTKPLIVSLAIFVIVLGVLYSFKNQIVAAWVNGQPIMRWDLVSELERQSGKKTLDYLITKTLILQEARKQNIVITDSEVSDQLKTLKDNIAKSGQDYQTLLTAQGITETDLKDQIKLQKIVNKIAGKGLTVSDKEIADYLKNNKEQLPADTSQATVTAQIKSQLLQQKISSAAQTWLASLRSKAKITTAF